MSHEEIIKYEKFSAFRHFFDLCSTFNVQVLVLRMFSGEIVLGPVYTIPFSYENGTEMLSYENGIV